MNIERRYSFRKVFWTIVKVVSFITLLIIITRLIEPRRMGKPSSTNLKEEWIRTIIIFLFLISFYYYIINYWYSFISKKKPLLSYLTFLLSFGYNLGKDYFLPSQEQELFNLSLLFFKAILNSLTHIGICFLIAYITYLIDERKKQNVLEEQKMQLEVEKSQANFNFLKAQINPHFLHNTLNFLYAKSLPYSPELSEGILTLSDIMRYALSEGNTRDGKALLKDEIEHLRNVIKINQLRFSNKLNVELVVEGVINGAQIIPFVLITLVENAFKHGDLKSIEHPIVIRIHIEGKKLYFYCSNKKKTGPKELSTGIGLDNIKKRLELAYGQQYQFHIKDEAEFYTTELTIDPL